MIRYDRRWCPFDTSLQLHGGKMSFVKSGWDGYREGTYCYKMPVWLLESPEDCERLFLGAVGTSRIEQVDFYLLHSLNRDSWQCGAERAEFLEQAQSEGLIKYVGFSSMMSFPFRDCDIILGFLPNSV